MSALITAASTRVIADRVNLGVNSADPGILAKALAAGYLVSAGGRYSGTKGFKVSQGAIHGHGWADLVRAVAIKEFLAHCSYSGITTLFELYPSHRVLRFLIADIETNPLTGAPQRSLDYVPAIGMEAYDTARDSARLRKVAFAAQRLKILDPTALRYNVIGPQPDYFTRVPAQTIGNYRCLDLDAVFMLHAPAGDYAVLLTDIYWLNGDVIAHYLSKIKENDEANASINVTSKGHLFWIGHPLSGKGGLLVDDVGWWEKDGNVFVPPQRGLPESYLHPFPTWLKDERFGISCLRTVPRTTQNAMYLIEILERGLSADQFVFPPPLVDEATLPTGWEWWAVATFGHRLRGFGRRLDALADATGTAQRKLCFPSVVQDLHVKYAARSMTSITHTAVFRAVRDAANELPGADILKISDPHKFAATIEGTALVVMAGEAAQNTTLDLWSLPSAVYERFLVYRQLKRALGEHVPVKRNYIWTTLHMFRYPIIALGLLSLRYFGVFRTAVKMAGFLTRVLSRSGVLSTVPGLETFESQANVIFVAPLVEELMKLHPLGRWYIFLSEVASRGLNLVTLIGVKHIILRQFAEQNVPAAAALQGYHASLLVFAVVLLSRVVHLGSTGFFCLDLLLHYLWNWAAAGRHIPPEFWLWAGENMGPANWGARLVHYYSGHVESWKQIFSAGQNWYANAMDWIRGPQPEFWGQVLAPHLFAGAPAPPVQTPVVISMPIDLNGSDDDDIIFHQELVMVESAPPVEPTLAQQLAELPPLPPNPIRGLRPQDLLRNMNVADANAGNPDHMDFDVRMWVDVVEPPRVPIVPEPTIMPLQALGVRHTIVELLRERVPAMFARLDQALPVEGHSLGLVVALSHTVDSMPLNDLRNHVNRWERNQAGPWESRIANGSNLFCMGVYPGAFQRLKEGLPYCTIPPMRSQDDMALNLRGADPPDLKEFWEFRHRTRAMITQIIAPAVWYCRPAPTVANTVGMALCRLLAATPGSPPRVQEAICADAYVLFWNIYIAWDGSHCFDPFGIMWEMNTNKPSSAASARPIIDVLRACHNNLVNLYDPADRDTEPFLDTAGRFRTIEVTPEDQVNWLNNFSGHKRIRNAAALREIQDTEFDFSDPGLNVITAMVKTDETLAKLDAGRPNLKPRLIAVLDPRCQAHFGPAVHQMTERLAILWHYDIARNPSRVARLFDFAREHTGFQVDYNVTYAYKPTATKLSKWMNAVLMQAADRDRAHYFLRVIVAGDDHLAFYALPQGRLMWLEGDVSMCDQSQSYPTLLRDASRYFELGLPGHMVLDLMWLSKSRIKLDVSKKRGEFVFNIDPKVGTKLSGGPDTAAGTSICVGETVISCIFYCFIEDATYRKSGNTTVFDGNNSAHDRFKARYVQECLKRGFKMKVSLGVYAPGCPATFLKGWWVHTGLGPTWTPLPSRIFKVGVADGDVVLKYAKASGERSPDPFVAAANHLANVAQGLYATFLTTPLKQFASVWRTCLKFDIKVRDWEVNYDEDRNLEPDQDLFADMVAVRYELSLTDLNEIASLYSVPVLPLFIVHPALKKLVAVDYS